MASDSLVEEARHLLNHPGWREPSGSDARRVFTALCDEVERLKSLNRIQQDSIRHLQEQLKETEGVRAAAANALPTLEHYWKLLEAPGNRAHYKLIADQLRTALHPQPEEGE